MRLGAHEERSGEAAAVQETSFELGSGLGVAVLGTVPTAAYRTGLPSVPGLGGGDRATAEKSFAAMEDLAPHLPARTADALREAGGHAYDRGFTAVTAIAAVGLACTGLLAAPLLRPRRTGE